MSIQEHIEALCSLGHRGSTTPNEKKAADYISKQLQSWGIETGLEGFQSHSAFTPVFAILYGGFALGGLLAWSHPFLGLLILSWFSILFWGESTSTVKVVNRLLPQRPSQNVLGRIKVERPERKLVLVAHCDSSKTGLSFHPKMVKSFRSSYILSVVMILVLLIVGVTRLSGGQGLMLNLFRWVAVAVMLYGILIMIYSDLTGVHVQGAADNASGVGVMLGLSEKIRKEPLENTELWILATGCEEVNLAGMLAFMERHSGELERENTYFFNFDSLGKGNLHYITGEGMLKVYPSSGKMIRLAEEVASGTGFGEISPHVYRLATLDALVPSSRGYPTLSMIALADDYSISNWHWHTDTIENMDFAVPQKAEEFALALIRLLDKD